MKQRADREQPSGIETAKALRHVKAVTSSDQYDHVRKILEADQNQRIAKAVEGLSEEDEFILMCLLMGTCTHIAPLEQRPSIATGKAAPDLLARFQPGYFQKGIPASCHSGYKCLIEVKSTTKDSLHLGGAQLQKLRSFADTFGLPLVFAVRFLRFRTTALWALVEDVDRVEKSISIGVSSVIQGIRAILWNEVGFLLMPGTYFQASYSRSANGLRVIDKQHGKLVAYQVVTRKGRHRLSGVEMIIAAAFFDQFGLREVKSAQEGEVTHIAYTAELNMRTTADLIYGINSLPVDEEGRLVYDAGSMLRELADGRFPSLVNKGFIDHHAIKFCEMGALGLMAIGDPTDTYNAWLSTGGIAQTQD
jgi:hypothetical protein